MNEPRDAQRGISRYKKFYDLEPRRVEAFGSRLAIPETIGLAGRALFTTYQSDKWHRGKRENYIHEHEGGVKVYRADIRAERVRVPEEFRRIDTLVLLGKCLGIAYVDDEDNEMLGLDQAGAQLYCVPSGHALLVITDKRRLDAMIWGGKLAVVERGIVG